MDNNKIPRRIMDSKLEGSRRVGESYLWWNVWLGRRFGEF
jgi:hypothetical protein